MKHGRKQAAYRFGLGAEWLCVCLLMAKGYRILGRRVKTPCGEIDILARRANTLAVIEVKARPTREDALYALQPAQQQRLVRAAQAVLGGAGKIAGLGQAHNLTIRFDLMIVAPRCLPRHLVNAWQG